MIGLRHVAVVRINDISQRTVSNLSYKKLFSVFLKEDLIEHDIC